METKQDEDLDELTRAARSVLDQVKFLQEQVSQPGETGEENSAEDLPQTPSLEEMNAIVSKVCAAVETMSDAFTPNLNWELAGAAFPQGLREEWIFASSAHEAVHILCLYLGITAERLQMEIGHVSLESDVQAFDGYDAELCKLYKVVDGINVPRLATTLDCEHGIVRRRRESLAGHTGPALKPTAISFEALRNAFNAVGTLKDSAQRILQALDANSWMTIEEVSAKVDLSVRRIKDVMVDLRFAHYAEKKPRTGQGFRRTPLGAEAIDGPTRPAAPVAK